MNVYILSQQNKKKKLLKNSLGAGTFILNAAVLSRKILVRLSIGLGLIIGSY